ncbi:molybdopterin-dependent oxidoreductase [Lipingzhangella sp. LS1_29]|uniref:Molybdopterin-dependent oxidoreductase n=1 Tax=Lipingzhangella rawalii TaxID=2055835 RepID=A0ABU2H1U4_9ACTN|nr:molybdopterin-dependent oxidoreductase [Lipingzhangella rawalii]
MRHDDFGTARRHAPTWSGVQGALVGLLVTALALGVAELAAALWQVPGPVVLVGDAVVDLSPATLTAWSMDQLGEYQKPVLLSGILGMLALSAPVLGAAALNRPWVGYVGLLGFAVVGAIAVLVQPAHGPTALAALASGTGAGAVGLGVLLHQARRTRAAGESLAVSPSPSPGPGQAGPGSGTSDASDSLGRRVEEETGAAAEPAGACAAVPARRGFLIAGAGVLGTAVTTAGIGRWLAGATGAAAAREQLRLPAPQQPLPPLPGSADLDIPGLAPFRTPNTDFYRIDTALRVPRVPPQQWVLRVHGMVDRPLQLSFDDILRRDLTEADTTLTCVSNEINGDLVGNTRWLGVDLAEILREAGVAASADQILSTSTDGWTCGTPTEVVLDGRNALLAIGMAGEPLPLRHGFPARMVVPGIYGFVGATKWVTDIKLTRFADEQAYWAQRGWAVRAPIKTMCRIDVPGAFAEVPAGETIVAGVAWAQRRGIDGVEVRVDGGAWRQAELAEVPGVDTWRQWVAELPLDPGGHTIEARATDGAGDTQTGDRTDPIPDGATGWPSIRITAS